MNIKTIIEVLKKEHEEIENRLKEFENLFRQKLNYEQLLEVYNKLVKIWYYHEKKEDEIFKSKIKKEERENLKLEHKSIKGHSEIIKKALDTEDRHHIKVVIDTDGRLLVNRLRNHMNKENKIYNSLI